MLKNEDFLKEDDMVGEEDCFLYHLSENNTNDKEFHVEQEDESVPVTPDDYDEFNDPDNYEYPEFYEHDHGEDEETVEEPKSPDQEEIEQ